MSDETQTSGKRSANPLLKVILSVILSAVALGVLYVIPGPVRAIDVYYKAGWMVAHWQDEKSFPSGSNVCTYLFCTRTDTVPKSVGGRKGYTSEVSYHYCAIHEPEFISMGNRFDGFLYFLYWGWAFFCSLFLAGLILFAILSPVLLFFGRIIPAKRTPEGSTQKKEPITERLQIAVPIAALSISLTSFFMFVWW